MAIKFVSIKCPECGSTLDIEEGRKQIYCSYCGAHIMVQNDNEYIFRQVDEARIKQTEVDAAFRMKQLEIQEKELEQIKSAYTRKCRICMAVFVLSIILMYVSPDTVLLGVFLLIIVFYTIILGWASYDEDKNTLINKMTVPIHSAQITSTMEHYAGRTAKEIKDEFFSAGFTNIHTEPVRDLNILTLFKSGRVKKIEINGDPIYKTDNVFDKNSKIVIYYHSK